MARKAKGYDTYVTFQDYTSGVIDLTKVIGWQNQFGVVSAKVDITTDYERLCTCLLYTSFRPPKGGKVVIPPEEKKS